MACTTGLTELLKTVMPKKITIRSRPGNPPRRSGSPYPAEPSPVPESEPSDTSGRW